jgi:hypothetical protein
VIASAPLGTHLAMAELLLHRYDRALGAQAVPELAKVSA